MLHYLDENVTYLLDLGDLDHLIFDNPGIYFKCTSLCGPYVSHYAVIQTCVRDTTTIYTSDFIRRHHISICPALLFLWRIRPVMSINDDKTHDSRSVIA